MAQRFGLAIHGGAGVIDRATLSAEDEAIYLAELQHALDVGYAVLERGGSASDAVVVAVTRLEECPLFNAGCGAVMSSAGTCDLDASIMLGATLEAGAVAGVQHVRNPIQLARQVIAGSHHVFLSGAGAETFAMDQGLELCDNKVFQTAFRAAQLDQAQRMESLCFYENQNCVPSTALSTPGGDVSSFRYTASDNSHKYGTVGCVACDQHGNLAAGTSTGGMTNKKYGRIGDAPVIGAGTFADNRTCAVSSTGWGEYFIRVCVAHDISAQLEYVPDITLLAAAERTLAKVAALGGDGGVICINNKCEFALPFNSKGMYRGLKDSSGRCEVAIFENPQP